MCLFLLGWSFSCRGRQHLFWRDLNGLKPLPPVSVEYAPNGKGIGFPVRTAGLPFSDQTVGGDEAGGTIYLPPINSDHPFVAGNGCGTAFKVVSPDSRATA